MTRTVAVRRIHEQLPQIRELGVERLALFGSVARDEAGDASDLDVIVVFKPGCKTFDNYMDLKLLLEDLFPGMGVDLVLESSLKPAIREKVLSQARDVA